MSETLVCRLLGQGAQWVAMDSNGGQLGQVRTGELSALSVADMQKHLILLAPGADILITSITIPIKSENPTGCSCWVAGIQYTVATGRLLALGSALIP